MHDDEEFQKRMMEIHKHLGISIQSGKITPEQMEPQATQPERDADCPIGKMEQSLMAAGLACCIAPTILV